MSAFIVNDKTITAIVQAMQQAEFSNWLNGHSARTEPQIVGQMLLDQNYRSVNYRYDENDAPRRFKMAYKINKDGYRDYYDFGETYGSICCYMYQACETPDWVGSDIYFMLCHLKDDLAEKMINELGYEYCWGL